MEKTMENEMETVIIWGYIGVIYWGNIGIMENPMEATIVYWGFIGIMEKKMEATIVSWDVSRICILTANL